MLYWQALSLNFSGPNIALEYGRKLDGLSPVFTALSLNLAMYLQLWSGCSQPFGLSSLWGGGIS